MPERQDHPSEWSDAHHNTAEVLEFLPTEHVIASLLLSLHRAV
jgi:hypothetical protein